MSNKMAPDLGKLDELAKVHALSYASPHHFTMSVNGLREVIAELQLPAGNKMALDALTAYQAAGIGNSTDFAKQAETLVHVEDDIRAFADATCAMRASSGAAQAAPRCVTCDGTGEVHRADGTWVGTCFCAEGKRAATTQAVRMLTDAEQTAIIDMHSTGRAQGDHECAEDIQRKFAEVNGLRIPADGKIGDAA